MKKISILFVILAILLSNVMCAVVGYNYGKMIYGIENAGYSAPAGSVFLLATPFLIGIVICVVLALVVQKK